jgi:CheY-like chemotaxis protein
VNLLSNAVKYNREGGHISVNCTTSGSERVKISVTDTGYGLPAHQIAQLFQPFNRLDQEGHGENGTGIGLVVCKRLVEIMGGVIEVSSVVGEGSVFSFDLPAASCQKSRIGAAALPHEAATEILDTHSATLLYVEDNPANLMLVEDLIVRRPRLRLVSASNGDAGVETAFKLLPEVILMDINLPGISGLSALRLIRANSATAHIPIVAISANASARDIAKGIDAGFFRYLTKPIRVDEFLATVDLALAYSETHGSAELPA